MIINNCLELLFFYSVPVFAMCVFVHGSEVMQCFICIQHIHLNSHIYSQPEVSVFYVPCLQFTVSFRGHFNAIQKFANQLFRSSAYQTGLSSSSAPPVSLFVRFFCHSLSSWQKPCTSDPSIFYRLFLSIMTNSIDCQSEKPACCC